MIPSILIKTDDMIVNVLCMQLLDAIHRLVPMSEFVESLKSLLARTEDYVGI